MSNSDYLTMSEKRDFHITEDWKNVLSDTALIPHLQAVHWNVSLFF